MMNAIAAMGQGGQWGSNMLGDYYQQQSANRATRTQFEAGNAARNMQQQLWGQYQQLQNPYLQAGQSAAGLLGSVMGSPYYQNQPLPANTMMPGPPVNM